MTDDVSATNAARDPQVKGVGAEAGDETSPTTKSPSQQSGDEGGQVSEVASMDPAQADTPISDDQSVAGNPTDESGETQEPEEAGPNAIPGDNDRSAQI